MDDLFSASTRERSFQNAPLAVRMRPNSLDEYVGQQKAVGKGSWLRIEMRMCIYYFEH